MLQRISYKVAMLMVLVFALGGCSGERIANQPAGASKQFFTEYGIVEGLAGKGDSADYPPLHRLAKTFTQAQTNARDIALVEIIETGGVDGDTGTFVIQTVGDATSLRNGSLRGLALQSDPSIIVDGPVTIEESNGETVGTVQWSRRRNMVDANLPTD